MSTVRAPKHGHALVALVSVLALLALIAFVPVPRAYGSRTVECQHPVMTGVEVSKLHDIASTSACPVALALFRWEDTGNHERALFGCHGIGHPYLRLHSFHGWHVSLTPYFVMSRDGQSFAVGGTDFPINCT